MVWFVFMVFYATFNKYFSYIMALSFIGGGNWSIQSVPITTITTKLSESPSWRGVFNTTLCDEVCH
jgi:hypothetical protein